MIRTGASTPLALVAFVIVGTAANAEVLLSREEALQLAFPAATVERKSVFLTADQQREAQGLSGDEAPPSALVAYYVAMKDGRPAGTAYFDTHIVRTMPETIMVVVDGEGRASRIEVLSFQEPQEYLPRARWYEQFQGKALNDDLWMKRGIRPVGGATLTARATTGAARRVLALHRVIQGAAVTKSPSP